jgi:biotin-(acetyl-CoA carboxylase) ligase
VNLTWDGTILVNGGRCGRLRMAASGAPEAVPDWLVVGLELQLWPLSEEMGLTPDDTALYAEGCSDVDAVSLLETWARHTLVWLDTWSDDGARALHREWIGLVQGQGEEISVLGHSGVFTGTDDRFGLLLKHGMETRLLPLTDLLETSS